MVFAGEKKTSLYLEEKMERQTFLTISIGCHVKCVRICFRINLYLIFTMSIEFEITTDVF